jgi:hypothetical protein
MSRTPLSNEIIDEKLKNFSVVRVGNFINSKTKLEFRCLKCDNLFQINYHTLIRSKHKCPNCATMILDKNIVNSRLDNIIIISEYKTNNTKSLSGFFPITTIPSGIICSSIITNTVNAVSFNNYSSYGVTGSVSFGVYERLVSGEEEISFQDFNLLKEDRECLTIKGNLKRIALLILQEVIKRKDQQTWTYDNVTYIPDIVVWGPFEFEVKNSFFVHWRTSLGDIKYSEKETTTLNQLLLEIEKLQGLKVFW